MKVQATRKLHGPPPIFDLPNIVAAPHKRRQTHNVRKCGKDVCYQFLCLLLGKPGASRHLFTLTNRVIQAFTIWVLKIVRVSIPTPAVD
jgi:hypothetical protein